ncbi:MAG: phosphoribosylamine--glycine ligase [Ignavibacteria bacterium]|nr:phosphoribosylamine--glycine ligase [Ignavibacteria bacterium]MCC7159419.1 phosphoribosylamine--glycine ligase [Ignavibacteria bacterium]
MKILVIGSGGREHAIVWKLKESPQVSKIYCAPGNAGIGEIAECINIKADDVKGLLKFVKDSDIDFTVVGPEVALEAGIVDEFNNQGLKIFGPQKNAARLEHSKIFAKDFMKRHNVPTAGYRNFSSTQSKEVSEYLESSKYPLVIKADGLAAGKGVVICANEKEAVKTVKEIFETGVFGRAGSNIVIEEFLESEEVSIFAICDGEDYIVLPASQDHKKIGEGETGKNTGGMGSFAPANKIATPELIEKVKQRIIEPVLRNMKSEGNEFKGCLYCGLMVDKSGDPYVIEFNTRFGDPETQAVLPLVSSDLLDMFIASAEGKIGSYKLELSNDFYCSVVLASKGYPDKYKTGREIKGLDKITKDCIVFHAGTKLDGSKVVSSGGRVLNVTGRSNKNLKEAINTAYENAEIINFENKYYRKDIGQKGL